MAIPDFQTLMLPLLEILGDQEEHKIRDVYAALGDRFGLTQDERSLQSPNSHNIVFNNRVGWTKTHLKKAGLLENPSRGKVKITARGLDVLRERPNRVDMNYLSRYDEYNTFRTRTKIGDEDVCDNRDEGNTPPPKLTPFELLEENYRIIRDQLADELLEQIQSSSPAFFERLVVDLLLAMGYGGSRKDAGEAIGQSNDEGIDGIIKEDKLGLDVIYIQAKRWQNPVGRQEIQGFVGSLEGKRARKGIFITTSQFTKNASEYVKSIEKKVILMDGIQLTQFMIDHGVGVTDVNTFTIKRVDSDYFMEE
jgi:restriction system protein